MEPGQWISNFREQHLRYVAGKLDDSGKRTYFSMREELAKSLVSAQGLTIPEGQNARRYFRVAHMYQVLINNAFNSVTRELSRAGFSAIVPSSFKEGDKVGFALTIARGAEPISGEARVVSNLKQQGGARVSFAIDHLNDAMAERLETALFDAVLQRLR